MNISEDLFGAVQKVADENGTTVVDVLRKFIKLGLVAAEIEKKEDAGIYIIDSGNERELKIF